MIREMIITELSNRGYKAEAQISIKNGVELEGIRILTDSNIAPIIYTEKMIENAENENKSLDEVVSAIINIYESNKAFEFDVNYTLIYRFYFKVWGSNPPHRKEPKMTNEMIILNARFDLMEEGILQGTGNIIEVEDENGEKSRWKNLSRYIHIKGGKIYIDKLRGAKSRLLLFKYGSIRSRSQKKQTRKNKKKCF